jgi:elongation factor Ts
MAEISASTVMKLRKMSGQGMMDCKQALKDADGDIDKAMELLKRKGLATLEKRAQREASEGIVVAAKSEDGKTAAMASLCCETDFVAKSDDFVQACELLKKVILKCGDNDKIVDTEVDGKRFGDIITELASKTGEKTQLGDFVRYSVENSGYICTYVHFNKKVGAIVKFETSDDKVAQNENFRKMTEDIAMHITAINPLALDEDGISQEDIEQEKAAYREQVKDKPDNIIDKIIDGKMKKFFSEKCLLYQEFVKDDSKTVSQVIKEAAEKAGGEAKIVDFERVSVG